jgi:hypothetical protein
MRSWFDLVAQPIKCLLGASAILMYLVKARGIPAVIKPLTDEDLSHGW